MRHTGFTLIELLVVMALAEKMYAANFSFVDGHAKAMDVKEVPVTHEVIIPGAGTYQLYKYLDCRRSG